MVSLPALWDGLLIVRTTTPFWLSTRIVTSEAWLRLKVMTVWFSPLGVTAAGLIASPLTSGELLEGGELEVGVGTGVGGVEGGGVEGAGPGAGESMPLAISDSVTIPRHAASDAESVIVRSGAPGGVESNRVPNSAPLFI